jgi:hypothetical protein
MMKRLFRQACFYWLTVIADCFHYYKSCEEVSKIWGCSVGACYVVAWGLNVIHPPSSKGHCFVIVAADYFTKWTETIPLKNMTRREMIEFITGILYIDSGFLRR